MMNLVYELHFFNFFLNFFYKNYTRSFEILH